MTAATPWQSGRLGASNGTHRLLFGRMHEDAEIERAAFRGKRRVFCIASAGCMALSLCDDHEVVACDINPVQLAYAQRRAHGGAIESGDADRLMKFVRTFMPLLGWRAGVIRDFLALSEPTEQSSFWGKHLDTRRFRACFDTLMSPTILRAAYAPRLVSSLPAGFGAILRKRLQRGFDRHANATNPYARALLLDELVDLPRPRIKSPQFVLGDAALYLESCPTGSFDALTLSNILDGADPPYRDRLMRALRHASTEDAVVVLRSFAEPPPTLATNRAELDRSLLWGVVNVGSPQSFFCSQY
jgi:hypothetical protein